MGSKIIWTGLTFIQCSFILTDVPQVTIVGGVIMIIGLILLWLDK